MICKKFTALARKIVFAIVFEQFNYRNRSLIIEYMDLSHIHLAVQTAFSEKKSKKLSKISNIVISMTPSLPYRPISKFEDLPKIF